MSTLFDEFSSARRQFLGGAALAASRASRAACGTSALCTSRVLIVNGMSDPMLTRIAAFRWGLLDANAGSKGIQPTLDNRGIAAFPGPANGGPRFA